MTVAIQNIFLDKLKKYFIYITIFIMLLQTTFFGGLFKIERAKAASASITQINFLTPNQTISINHKSNVIIAQTQNISSTPETVSVATTIALTSDSATGRFSTDGTSWSGSNLINIDINTGFSDINFYYKDSNTGNFVITATVDSTGITNTHNISLVSDAVKPVTASVTTPENDKTYNASTMPTIFSGQAADDASGDGLYENSTVYKLKNTKGDHDGKFWNGAEWIDNQDLAWMSTTHPATSDGTEVDWTSNANMPSWTDGTYKIQAKAIDKLGNSFKGTEVKFYYDNTNPEAEPRINKGEDVTSNLSIDLHSHATNDTTKMKVWGDITTPDAGFVAYSHPRSFTLVDGNALKTLYAQYEDDAGNFSPVYTLNIFYSTNKIDGNHATVIDDTGVNDYDIFGDGSVLITAKALTGETTKFFGSKYDANPVSTTSGITFLNMFYDFSIQDDSEIDFPVTLKFYYDESDLTAAGITEDQLQGVYYYDFMSGTWRLYSEDGSGSTTEVNKDENYVWVTAYHLTPMAVGGDITPPEKPANLTAAAGNTEVQLNWNKVDDAAGYYVKYRVKDGTFNSPVYLSGGDTLSTKITGLANGTEYEFQVAAKDQTGNIGEYANVFATPIAPKVATETSSHFVSTAYAADSTNTNGSSANTDTNKNTDENVNNDDKETTEGSENDSEGTNWTRIAVTLGILALAAGAGFGGYYGYQWWIAGKEEENEDKEEKKKKKNGRW